jgi:hypothetical protein
MFDAIIADSGCLDGTGRHGILDGSPALQSFLPPSIRAVEEEKVNVAQPGLVKRGGDSLARGIV